MEITAICDLSFEKLNRATKLLEEKGRPSPARYTDYHAMLREADLDAVVIMTGWNDRLSYAMDAMEAGKYTAIKVGCAYDISECYALVETFERTGSPVMMLENCCYGRREMAALRMAKEGLFGEIVQCSGGYYHYLNNCELFLKKDDGTVDANHYRLEEYVRRNCDQYPTHELGPISKVLNINRGKRMLSLRSFTTKSVGLETYIREHVPEGHPHHGVKFRQGDIVTTLIECAGGEQIQLVLDTTLPRAFYSRGFTVRGTKGMCVESAECACTFYTEGMPEGEAAFNNEMEWYKEHDHPLHAEYATQVRGRSRRHGLAGDPGLCGERQARHTDAHRRLRHGRLVGHRAAVRGFHRRRQYSGARPGFYKRKMVPPGARGIRQIFSGCDLQRP